MKDNDAAQFRAARAMLGRTTRQVAKDLGYSATAISKLERGEIGSSAQARLYFDAIAYYEKEGLAFYAGGVIPSDRPDLASVINCVRERFAAGYHGSAYVLALDRLVSLAMDADLNRLFPRREKP